LSKYGANLVLATQSLSRLAELDRASGRGLRAVVFANIDGLFAFNCSAEDAEYLVPELGGALDEQDLVELGEHQCYARLSSGGQRLPTFSVQLDPPLRGDAAHGQALATASAARFGRPAELVEADQASAFARVDATHVVVSALAPAEPTAPPEAMAVEVAQTPAQVTSGRNQHRPRKKRRAQPTETGTHT
jgi:hypothetical protein